MASFLSSSYRFKTRNYTLTLSSKERAPTTFSGPVDVPRGLVNLHAKKSVRWCSRPLNSRTVTVDGKTAIFDEERSYQFDSFNLLFPHTTKQVVEKVFSMASEIFYKESIKLSECKFLERYMSTFARYATIAAAKKGVEELVLVVKITMETVMLYDDVKTVTVAIRDSEGGETLLSECSLSLLPSFDGRELPKSCSICLDKFSFSEGEELACMPCSHVFHQGCIQMWIERSGSCPVCRFDV